jgi:tetratricopeptide (TPR) repeat protein
MPCVATLRQPVPPKAGTGAGNVDEDLLHVAFSRPTEAVRRAEGVLRAHPDDLSASIAHQTIGIVRRDSGDLGTARHELRASLRLARRSGDQQRTADVLATLGAALVMAGSTAQGLGHLDEAVRLAHGQTLARVRMRRADLLRAVGRHDEALREFNRALVGIRRSGDAIWEARALNNRGLAHLGRGDATRAERDLQVAHELFTAAARTLEAAVVVNNRGVVAFSRNDIPRALRLLSEAERSLDELGYSSADVRIDRSNVLLAAGLFGEAGDVADAALAKNHDVPPPKRAELLLIRAGALLAQGDPEHAERHASAAAALFRQQRRDYWLRKAQLAVAQARFARGRTDRRLVTRVSTLAEELEALRAEEAPLAHLLAGRVALVQGLTSYEAHLAAAARYRRAPAPLSQVTGWLAQAMLCEAREEHRRAMHACAKGLEALTDYCAVFGTMEFRALGTRHGVELARIGLRLALGTGKPLALLRAAERWGALSLSIPSVVPEADAQAVSELTAIREVERRLGETVASGGATTTLQRERLALESAVRSKKLMLRAGGLRRHQFELATLTEHLGASTLVEVIEVDDVLHAVVVADGRATRREVGTTAQALSALGTARFTLHGIGRGVPLPFPPRVGQDLQGALLGPAAELLGPGPVVVSPPARFHGAPWGLMPALEHRPVSVTPSAALWVRAQQATAPSSRKVVLVGGPRLDGGELELSALREHYPSATVLRGEDATVERVLDAVDGAWLVHLATHGVFRPDNPMFSNLTLYDGPLTVHDLERLRRPPYRIVLSACDSGIGSPTGAEELLGLQSALIGLGTAGIASSVAQVNDRATIPLMVDLHAALGAGLGLPQALSQARRAAGSSPVERATAASFMAFGV